MMINKITPYVDYHWLLKRLDQLIKTKIKVPKVVKPTNNKTSLYDFGDYCNKQSDVHPLPGYNALSEASL